MLAAWNRWIADFCTVDPQRLKGVGCVILDDVDGAIREMERCRELGLASVNVPSQLEGPHYGTDAYDRFWAAAQDLDMPISTHIGSTRGALSHSRAREAMRRMAAGPVRDYSSGAVALPGPGTGRPRLQPPRVPGCPTHGAPRRRRGPGDDASRGAGDRRRPKQ